MDMGNSISQISAKRAASSDFESSTSVTKQHRTDLVASSPDPPSPSPDQEATYNAMSRLGAWAAKLHDLEAHATAQSSLRASGFMGDRETTLPGEVTLQVEEVSDLYSTMVNVMDTWLAPITKAELFGMLHRTRPGAPADGRAPLDLPTDVIHLILDHCQALNESGLSFAGQRRLSWKTLKIASLRPQLLARRQI